MSGGVAVEVRSTPYREDIMTLLEDDVAVIARKELREDSSTRADALATFRSWISKNKDLDTIWTDSNFLLRFLRVKKFSVPMAQDMLLKYLNLRQTFPHFCLKLDPIEPRLSQLIDNGYLFPSPIRDSSGRRVIIGIAANFDPSRFDCKDMARMHCLTYEALLDDERSQVLGFTHFGDLKGISTSHITIWSPTEFATAFKWGEQSVPMRHKKIHLVNMPTPLKYVYDFVRGRLSEKLRDRFLIHGSTNELLNHLDRKVLPKEYGGDIPMADMIASWKQELYAKKEKLMALDDMKLLDNSCLMKKRDKNNNANKNPDIFSLSGSFRKLEVD